jgi:DNA-binding beta-propeller fold protein YncE
MTRNYLAMSVAVCTAILVPLKAQDAAPLRLIRSIPLPAAVHGPFDHLAVDLAHHRLFVTPEDYKAILVLDLGTGAVIHEISGIGRPHAVLYREDVNRIYVTDGEEGVVKTFDGATYRPLKTTTLSKDADSIGYDPSRKLLYVDNGGKDEGKKFSLVSIVDTGSDKKLADITIEGETLEAMALDVFRPRMYVNNRAKNQIETIDRWKGAVVASWPVTLCKDNVAMGLDEQHQRLFAACRDGKVSIFDSNTGKELQAVPITRGVDDLVYDAGTKRIYAAGNGVVSVVEQTDADHYRSLGNVPTGPGGKTALLVPSLNRYFVAIPQHDSQNASIVEMEPAGIKAVPAADPVVSLQVDAPAAEQLILTTMSAHPYLRKMGLHAIPQGAKDSVIIANANAGRIGVKSSDGDLDAVKDGKTYCVKRDDGAFYNVKMPLFNAARQAIGILVMEIPYTSAQNEADAIRQAEDLRTELAQQIPGLNSLFQFSLDVSAPLGQKLVEEAMAAHPEVQKMGLHVNTPRTQENLIIANNIRSKIGKKSSDGDMSVVRSGKPTVSKVGGAAPFYDLGLPLSDASGKSVGMIVMEIRGAAARDEADALRQAGIITKVIAGKISSEAALFADR